MRLRINCKSTRKQAIDYLNKKKRNSGMVFCFDLERTKNVLSDDSFKIVTDEILILYI